MEPNQEVQQEPFQKSFRKKKGSNNNNNYNYGKSRGYPRGGNNPNQVMFQEMNKLRAEIRKFHAVNGKKTFKEIVNNPQLKAEADGFGQFLRPNLGRQKRQLLQLLGEKEAANLDAGFARLSLEEKTTALKEMLADDLPQLLAMGAKALIPHIPALWDYAKKLGSAYKSNGLMGLLQTGIDSINQRNDSLMPLPPSESSFNEVDIDFLCCVLDPGVYMSAATYLSGGTESAVNRTRITYPITVNANGEALFMYFPYGNPYGQVDSAAKPAYIVKNAADLALSTGIQGQANYVLRGASPLNPCSGLSMVRNVCIGIEFISTVSTMNNQGKMEMAYFPEKPSISFLVNGEGNNQVNSGWEGQFHSVGTTAMLARKTYYVFAVGNKEEVPMMTSVPPDSGEQTEFKPLGWPEQADVVKRMYDKGAVMAIAFSGCQANTVIGNLLITQVAELQPDETGAKAIPVKMPPPGVRTIDVYNVMKNRIPRLPVLSRSERSNLCDLLNKCRGIPYGEIIQRVTQFSEGVTSVQTHLDRRHGIGSYSNINPIQSFHIDD